MQKPKKPISHQITAIRGERGSGPMGPADKHPKSKKSKKKNKKGKNGGGGLPPICPHCKSDETEQWNRSPMWECNSCGTIFSKGSSKNWSYNTNVVPYDDDDDDVYETISLKHQSPRQIGKYLQQYVIGQRRAIKVLSLQTYRHNQRSMAYKEKKDREFDSDYDLIVPRSGRPKSKPMKSAAVDEEHIPEKSNILLLGPTGSGKTLVTKRLAQATGVPFSISDATSLTQAGYVGEDVESVVTKLLNAAEGDVELAERGIVFIDEIDKIAAKAGPNGAGRDVGGEGVQQGLLKMLEGTEVECTWKNPQNNKKEPVTIDTTNIMFVLSGAFSGIEKVVARRRDERKIGFADPSAKEKDVQVKGKDGTDLNEDDREVWDVTVDDLKQFGMIPEFIGRISCIVSLHMLNADDLVRVLTEPKNALIPQYQWYFKQDECKLHFKDCALTEIASQAYANQTGARGLRTIVENVLLDAGSDAADSYNNTSKPIANITIDAEVVRGEKMPLYEDDPPEFPKGGRSKSSINVTKYHPKTRNNK